MNAKTTRKYNLIVDIAAAAPENPQLPVWLAELCAIEFQTAFEMWEYTLSKNQARLGDPAIAANLEEKPFTMFTRISEQKTKTLLLDSGPLQKLIYQNCVTAAQGVNLVFLSNLLLTNKPELADEALRNLKANATGDYGERIRAVVDAVFTLYCTKNNVKVPSLTKKQARVLLTYIEKIKGPNRALLTQRIKEL